jgi:hypothetical protein
MLHGTPPFCAASDLELVEQQLEAPPPPLDPSVPDVLRGIVGHALAKHQADRYFDAAEMATALEAAALQLAE